MSLCRQATGFIPVLIVLLFLGALFWAKQQDPFSRKWFTLKTKGNHSFQCVAVLPKPMRPYPVILYAHGSGGSLMSDGHDLRQMAELGLAVVSLEYDQTNESAFSAQFETLLHHLGRQEWADTNAIAWVGYSLGSIRMLDFADQHPESQPQLLVLLGGAGIQEGALTPLSSPMGGMNKVRCPVLLLHGELDETFPVAGTKRLASLLRTHGAPLELKIIPGMPHSLGLERGVVFRCIGEYCRERLAGKNAWQNYRSIAQWQSQAPPLWLFWLPAGAWVGGRILLRHRRSPAHERIKLQRPDIALRWLALLLASWALVETAIHLVPPHLAVNGKTLSIARRYLVQPKERADFESLAALPIWSGHKLKTFLDHMQLAGYNRELIDWKLDAPVYRDFVLSPVVTGRSGEMLDWRRRLWEEFYPRIRRKASPEEAAAIVVRHLRERVSLADLPELSRDTPSIWLKQITDPTGFEIICVAALRSVGVPARLDSQGRAEIGVGGKWQLAPRPSVSR